MKRRQFLVGSAALATTFSLPSESRQATQNFMMVPIPFPPTPWRMFSGSNTNFRPLIMSSYVLRYTFHDMRAGHLPKKPRWKWSTDLVEGDTRTVQMLAVDKSEAMDNSLRILGEHLEGPVTIHKPMLSYGHEVLFVGGPNINKTGEHFY